MPDTPYPTIEQIRQFVRYDPESGKLYWLPKQLSDFVDHGGRYTAERSLKSWNKKCLGKECFNTPDRKGYLMGKFNKWSLFAHRIGFALMENRWPEVIDHIDGNGMNNCWSNLREVTQEENMRNRCQSGNNRTGMMGVVKPKGRNKYQARIEHKGKVKHLGCFETYEEACRARKDAEVMLGFHANHNRR